MEGPSIRLTAPVVSALQTSIYLKHAKAVLPLDIPEKYVAALGVNIDCGHGVVQEELDQRLVDMQCSGTMICSYPLSMHDAPAVYFTDVVSQCAPTHSVVQSLVVAAMHLGLAVQILLSDS
ncbi:unnamed protein product [Symbiodinium sp. CCMP2592]|nr:unnamed protein product [Symbiodinium sp. CCMP2592]